MDPRNKEEPEIQELSDSLTYELVTAVGLPKKPFFFHIFKSIFRKITTKLALIGAPFDRKIAKEGLVPACKDILENFCYPANTFGIELVPQSGPLLIVANHAGAYDALEILQHVNRPDTHWIGTEIPFLELLPFTRQHIIFAPRKDSRKRAIAMRNAIRHLKEGGALLYFATGHRDPDPAVFPGAENAIEHWLNSFNTFFKYVPNLQLIHCMVSGVVSEKWAHHAITRLRRKQIDRHRLAEFGQVMTQLVKPGKFYVTPSISFGKPVDEATLKHEAQADSVLPAVIARGKDLLHQHIERFGGMV